MLILSDPDSGFAESLEKQALKWSPNNVMHIQQEFINALKSDPLKEINEKNFLDKKGIVSKYTQLGTGIGKWKVKYKALKQEWSRITDRIKNGSGFFPDKEPRWFENLNPVFCEANETINLSSSAADTSIVNERNESHNKSEDLSYSAKGNPAEYSEDEVQIDRDTATPAQNRKIVVAPHKKSKQIRSNKQALSEIAKSLKCFSEAQNKHHQKYLHEERRQEEEVRREKAEKDRQHEFATCTDLLRKYVPGRGFLFQPETSQQIVQASYQSFHISISPR